MFFTKTQTANSKTITITGFYVQKSFSSYIYIFLIILNIVNYKLITNFSPLCASSFQNKLKAF